MRLMRTVAIAALMAGTFSNIQIANAATITTWNLAAGGTWNAAASWNPAVIPNGVGDSATFNDAASGSNPAQTGNRSVTLDGSKTVGTVVFNNDAANAFTNTIATGTAGPLVFDEVGAGPATMSVPAGSGTGNNTISVAMTFNDDVVANVANVNATSAAGAINLTGTIGGAGGFTKNGDGLATFGTGAKTYTGATVFNGGRMRISAAARPTGTSSVTLNSGATLDLISASLLYTFGATTSVPFNLNGTGATTGPFASFPGAIRNDTGLDVAINNVTVLQSNTLLHVQANAGTGSSASPAGSLAFTSSISGPGKLTLTAPGSNIDQGTLFLKAANTYSGGSLVAGGILDVQGANATFGNGNVTVDNATSPASIARLHIETGVLNAIDDMATLSLAGGGAANTADQNFAIVDAGVHDYIGGLFLGGVQQFTLGTYGSSSSGATFQNDEYFSGTGVVELVPEPTSLSLVGFAIVGLAMRRRKA
jgi:autotransporter-associated beta strand protein